MLTRLTLVVATLLCVAAAPAEAPAGDADELAEVLAELRSLRRDFYADRRKLEAEIGAARAAITRLETGVAALDRDRRSVEEAQSALREEVAGLEERVATAKADVAAIVADSAAFATAERGRVAAGLPVRRARRLARLDVVAAAETAAASFGGAWSHFQDELRFARTGELLTDLVKLPDGREKHARIIRVGNHFLGLVTEDGEDVALWVEGEGWVTDRARVRPDAIRAAIDIFDRRRVPDLVRLPVAIMLRREDAER